MIYPIKILEKNLSDISHAVARIDNAVHRSGVAEDSESRSAKRKLFKRAKDLTDAIGILKEYSTVDEKLQWSPSVRKSKN